MYNDFISAVSFQKDYFTYYPFNTFIEKEFEMQEAKEAFEYAIKYKPYRA